MIVASLLTLPLVGCVAQQEYDNVAESNLTYQSRIEQLNQEKRTLEATVDRKQVRIDELEAEVGSLRGTRDELSGKIQDVQTQQNRLRDRLGNIRLAGLDPETDRALEALAASNPNLIAYDGTIGMVRFTSDLTFDSGSDVVKEGAKSALQQLATILQASAASNYEIHVVGHTDNQRISNPATRSKHPTNRHLSVHRSIAVSEALQSAGLPATRILVAGWGENQPVVPNSSKGGTAENRRVELFIMPPTYTSSPSAGTVSNEAAVSQPEGQKEAYPTK